MAAHRNSGYVFSAHDAKPAQMLMLQVLKRMGHDLNVHDFRSSFPDWCAETGKPTRLPRSGVGTRHRQDRRRLPTRRSLSTAPLMNQWAKYRGRVPAEGDNIVEMRGAS
jgi:hypothetical protein